MKKSMIFVGLLAIGFANAQEGNVGINTDQPKATLDIQPNATNLVGTTNQGILAPRLSKVRVANIETPVEGTLVYVTDETTSPISAYTGANAKVAKITEKGYYFYNGTEWVKAGVGENDKLWGQRPSTNDPNIIETYLKPATENGNQFLYSSDGAIVYEGTSSDGDDTGRTSFDEGNFYIRRHNSTGYGPSILLTSGRGTYKNPTTNKVGDNLGRLLSAPTIDPNVSSGWASSISTIMTDIQSATSYSTNLILGARPLNEKIPIGTLFIEGKTGRVGIGVSSPKARLEVNGTFMANTTTIHGDGPLGSVINLQNTSKNTDTEINRWTFYNLKQTDDSVYRAGLAIFGYDSKNQSEYSKPRFIITDSGNVGIGSRYVYKANPEVSEALTVDGKIKATSLEGASGSGDRIVYADENGVLKVGSTVSTKASEVASTNAMECNAQNRGKMNFVKDVPLAGGGTADAFAVCLKGSDGNHYWRYLYGAGGETTGGGNFGTGLQ